MASSTFETTSEATEKARVEKELGSKLVIGHKEPLKLSGALDHVKRFDVTPIIGTEFEDVDLATWLRAPNSDELIRDLAITSTLSSPKYFLDI